MNVLADLHAEKHRRGFGIRLRSKIILETNQPSVRKNEYNNIWYLVFFWLLFFKTAGIINISYAAVLFPLMLKFWWWVRYSK